MKRATPSLWIALLLALSTVESGCARNKKAAIKAASPEYQARQAAAANHDPDDTMTINTLGAD